MDTQRFGESEYLKVDDVRNGLAHGANKLVIMDEAKAQPMDYQGEKTEKLCMTVGYDGKTKKWSPNMDTVKNIHRSWGVESKFWIGKMIKLQIVTLRSKDSILGIPVEEEVVGAAAPSPALHYQGLKE